GVCRAGLLPGSRCALTAPFHPCLIPSPLRAPGHRRSALCCTFRRLAPPRRYLAPCPVEPGLSSACLRMTRLSGRLRGDVFYGFAVRIPHALLKQSAGPANLHLQSPAAAAAAPL